MKIDQVVRITNRMKAGTEVYTAKVTGFERKTDHKGRPGVYFGYVPCDRPDSIVCGFGYAWLLDTPGEYGVQSVTPV